MPVLYLLRHGELLPNPEHRFIGQLDIALSKKGYLQALYWQKEFSSLPLTRGWSSDLPRCRDTAKHILREHRTALELEPAFREINLGAWQGLNKKQVEQKFPGALSERKKDFWNYTPEGGESFSAVARRVLPALKHKLLQLSPDEQAVLVAHAGVNRIILLQYLALDAEKLFMLPQPYAACTGLYYSQQDILSLPS